MDTVLKRHPYRACADQTCRDCYPVSRYNPDAVDASIRSSRTPIGAREGKMIHAILKGHARD